MKLVRPPPMRSQVEATQEGLRITIPARRPWFLRVFLLIWLVAFAAAVYVAFTRSQRTMPLAFVAITAVMFCVVSLAAIQAWSGYEHIELAAR